MSYTVQKIQSTWGCIPHVYSAPWQGRTAEPSVANSLWPQDNFTVQELRVTVHKTSACRWQWVDPVHPASLGLVFHDICAHCSQVPLWSLEHRDALSQQRDMKGHVRERATDPMLPPHGRGDQTPTGTSG